MPLFVLENGYNRDNNTQFPPLKRSKFIKDILIDLLSKMSNARIEIYTKGDHRKGKVGIRGRYTENISFELDLEGWLTVYHVKRRYSSKGYNMCKNKVAGKILRYLENMVCHIWIG